MARQFNITDIFQPQPKQLQFYQAMKKYQFILYGGAAGGGKSWILRWSLLIFLLENFLKYGVRHVRVGLFCEDYPSLKDRQLAKIQSEFPKWLGKIKEDKALGLIFQLKEVYGGGFICLRNLDDSQKYDSVEFAAIAVDELSKNYEVVFNELRKRLRWPVVPGEPSFPPGFIHPFLAGTNPGGKGHRWIKAIWIDPFVKGDWTTFPKNLLKIKDKFCFIQALATDNKYNPEDYYDSNLSTLPEQMRLAMAEGNWDLFEGQYFNEWREKYHVVDDFEVPDFWIKFWAGDWGYYPDYFCGLWFAVSPQGEVYCYREAYGRRILPSKWAESMIEATAGEELQYRKLDPKSWASWMKGESEKGFSIAEDFSNCGWECSPAAAAPGDRINGWTRIREYLSYEEDESLPEVQRTYENLKIKPRLRIFKSCRNLIRTLPILIHDEVWHEDVKRKGLEDHAPDALRYALMTRPSISIQPVSELEPDWQDAVALMRRRTREKETPDLRSPFDELLRHGDY